MFPVIKVHNEQKPMKRIIGNNVAAMISAITLAKEDVAELITPSKTLGGYFGGVKVEDHFFDAGMNLLEFSAYNSDDAADVNTYNPEIRNDVGRFTPVVKKYLDALTAYNKVPTPQMYISGQYLPDLFIANNLTALQNLPDNTKNTIKKELEDILKAPVSLHASKKHDSIFMEYSLEAVSIVNHGKTFHDMFIEPFCQKMTNRSTSKFLALYHRMLWLPLYYPETLLDALNGKCELKESEFHYPCYFGSFASLISYIEDEMRENAINVVNKKPTLSDAEDADVWTLDQDTLLSLCEISPIQPDKSSINLVFILVKTEDVKKSFSTLFIPQDKTLPFRITNQTVCSGKEDALTRLCVEWGSDETKDYITWTHNALLQLGIIDTITHIRMIKHTFMKNAIMLPTLDNLKNSITKRQILKALFPEVKFIGASAPFSATSFNDQVIQGLKI